MFLKVRKEKADPLAGHKRDGNGREKQDWSPAALPLHSTFIRQSVSSMCRIPQGKMS